MKIQKPVIPKRFRPEGFEILHEDPDLIVVDKAAGILSVAALWNHTDTVHSGLNFYVQKGNPKSKKFVHIVHRLDQGTSGILVFAKTEAVQRTLKNNWAGNKKIYFAIVHGKLKNKSGLIESFLEEDDDYKVHSSQDKEKGKLARTEYRVIKETPHLSLVKINLLTGKKNQIRVHMSEMGNPVIGDSKYGAPGKKGKEKHEIMLHAYSLELTHPFKNERVTFVAPIPERFNRLIDCSSIEE